MTHLWQNKLIWPPGFKSPVFKSQLLLFFTWDAVSLKKQKKKGGKIAYSPSADQQFSTIVPTFTFLSPTLSAFPLCKVTPSPSISNKRDNIEHMRIVQIWLVRPSQCDALVYILIAKVSWSLPSQCLHYAWISHNTGPLFCQSHS